MRTSERLDKLITRLETTETLDKPASVLAGLARKAIPAGPVEDVLSGTPIGHPLHPALVAVPIGAWTSASVFDLLGNRRSARTLIGLGVLTALPTAAAGVSDWLRTQGAEQRVGFVHALANDLAIGAYGASWLARRRGGKGALTTALGGVALAVSGWLGGHLTYAQGVGVDTTAFTAFPTEWTSAGPVPVGDGPHQVQAGGAPIFVIRRADHWSAMADRCTHRGAPLHEGTVEDGCIVCPWHDSAFRLDDGTVRSGPATRPQPLLDVRVVDGRIELRRSEPRTLRTNPV